jgi:hypothetical protein
MTGMYDSRDSIMERSSNVGAEIERVQPKNINVTNTTYEMEGEI